MTQSFVVVTGGSPPHPGVLAHLPDDRFVIAADSGLDHAHALGLHVDLVVGDLDSVSPEGLAAAEGDGVTVERHPTAKEAIDTELAIEAALDRGAGRIVVVTGGGDRLDQLLAGLLVLGHPMVRGTTVEAWVGEAHVQALRGPGRVELCGRRGDYVSLVPIGGDVEGVTTAGLRYGLHGERLRFASTRGVSNEFATADACVAADRGVLLVIAPHALGGDS
jgi:thiamine pyrophosphokinase